MPFVIYDPNTGFIKSTGSLALSPDKKPDDAASLQRIADSGLAYIETPVFVTGETHKVNLNTGLLEDLPPPPPAPPDLLIQLISALISNGVISSKDFSSESIGLINSELASANMEQISVLEVGSLSNTGV